MNTPALKSAIAEFFISLLKTGAASGAAAVAALPLLDARTTSTVVAMAFATGFIRAVISACGDYLDTLKAQTPVGAP